MNAQALNFDKIFQITETQKSDSADFDLSDDSFSKTLDKIKAKYENEEKNIKSSQDSQKNQAANVITPKTDAKSPQNNTKTVTCGDSATETTQNKETSDTQTSEKVVSTDTKAIENTNEEINSEIPQNNEKISVKNDISPGFSQENAELSAPNAENLKIETQESDPDGTEPEIKQEQASEEPKTEINLKQNTQEPETEAACEQNTQKSGQKTDFAQNTEKSESDTGIKQDIENTEPEIDSEQDFEGQEPKITTEQAIFDAISTETTAEILNNTSISQETTAKAPSKGETTVDSGETLPQKEQTRINNLKTSSTTTVHAIISSSDETQTANTGDISADKVILAEVEDGVQVKASEKVEKAAKDGAISQTKELSSQAKQTALENLQSIQGTDTTIVDAKAANQANTGTNSDSSYSQGNAAEQVIKMTIENIDADSTAPAGTFQVQTDKAASQISSTIRNLDLNKADIMNQIGTKMQQLPETGQSKVTIILKPENLGRIQLEIINTNDGITARMLTENQQVKELLDKNMETLKSQLSAQGVNVNHIKVENTQQSSQNFSGFEQEQFSREFFGNSHEHHAKNADSSRAYEENNREFKEDGENSEPEIVKTQILHNGNVDYKV